MGYISTAIIAILLTALILLIVRHLRKQKKAGKSPTCSCGCNGCAMSGMCHRKS